jgi:BlaI family transcriptional regulator, penicillinase repressor
VEIVVRHDGVSVNEVLAELPDPPSYSAVRGMLRLLEEKGYLRHEERGPRYVYFAAGDPEQVKRSAARHLLRTFFHGSMESAVSAMLGEAERPLSDEEVERITHLIESARKGIRRRDRR